MALLLAAASEADGESGGRGLLRSSGIRRPWMPAPLLGGAAMAGRAVGVALVAAAVAMPGATAWMPRPLDGGAPPPEDRPQPTTLVVTAPPIPGANTLWLRAPRDEPAPVFDRLSPTLVTVLTGPPVAGQFAHLDRPMAGADRISTSTAILTSQPPAPAARTTWLARPSAPADAHGPPPWLVRSDPAQPGAITTWLTRPANEPAPPETRPWPLVPAQTRGAAPEAVALWLGRPRDEPAPPAEGLPRGPLIVQASAQAPGTPSLRIGRPLAAPQERGVAPLLRVPAIPPPGAIVVWAPRGLEGASARPRGPIVVTPPRLPVDAVALLLRAPRAEALVAGRAPLLSVPPSVPPGALSLALRAVREPAPVAPDRPGQRPLVLTAPVLGPAGATLWVGRPVEAPQAPTQTPCAAVLLARPVRGVIAGRPVAGALQAERIAGQLVSRPILGRIGALRVSGTLQVCREGFMPEVLTTMTRGDTPVWEMTVYDDAGAPFDLTGYTAYFTAKRTFTEADPGVFQLSTVNGAITYPNAAGGVMRIQPRRIDTNTLTEDTSVIWDVQISLNPDTTFTVDSWERLGKPLVIRRDVTRAP